MHTRRRHETENIAKEREKNVFQRNRQCKMNEIHKHMTMLSCSHSFECYICVELCTQYTCLHLKSCRRFLVTISSISSHKLSISNSIHSVTQENNIYIQRWHFKEKRKRRCKQSVCFISVLRIPPFPSLPCALTDLARHYPLSWKKKFTSFYRFRTRFFVSLCSIKTTPSTTINLVSESIPKENINFSINTVTLHSIHKKTITLFLMQNQ